MTIRRQTAPSGVCKEWKRGFQDFLSGIISFIAYQGHHSLPTDPVDSFA